MPKHGFLPPIRELAEMRILIVDDESMLRSVILEYLELIGVNQRFTAEDGQQALDVLRAQPPDEPIHCMISDIRMPRMELKELLAHIDVEFPEIMVVATSGYSDVISAHEIFSKGAQDFLAKPLNLDNIEVVLNWYLERGEIIDAVRVALNLAMAKSQRPCSFASVRPLLKKVSGVYADKMSHAARVGELAETIETGMREPAVEDLRLIAHLHEIGEGIQILDLCEQPRDLLDDELQLVRSHGFISGRLIAKAYRRPDLQEIVACHLRWERMALDLSQEKAIAQSLTIWLGLLNSIDGWMTDRPDRAAVPPAQLRATLEDLFLTRCGIESHPILRQWEKVEKFYSA